MIKLSKVFGQKVAENRLHTPFKILIGSQITFHLPIRKRGNKNLPLSNAEVSEPSKNKGQRQ